MSDNDFLVEIQEEFLEEAAGFIEETETHFLSLEHRPDDKIILENILRLAHNLKGSAAAVGFEQFSHFAHSFENLLVEIKAGTIIPSSKVVDVLLASNDMLKQFVDTLQSDKTASVDTTNVVSQITKVMSVDNDSEEVAPEELSDEISDEISKEPLEEIADKLITSPVTKVTPIASSATEEMSDEAAAKLLQEMSATTTSEPVNLVLEDVSESVIKVDNTIKNINSQLDEISQLLADEPVKPAAVKEIKIADIPKAKTKTETPKKPVKIEKTIEVQKTVEAQKAPYKDLGTILVEQNKVTQEQIDDAAAIQTQRIGEILVKQGAIKNTDLDEALQKQQDANKGKKPDDFIRLPIKKIEDLLNDFSEQVILQSSLDHYKNDISANANEINRTIMLLGKITHALQQTVISLRMLSLKNVFNKMQRTVRDTAKLLGKKVDFISDGDETELDKTMVDEISSPLTHIIRNSVDHGIESPEDRIKKGKNPAGFIKMSAGYRGRYFYLEIEDDGKGLDRDRILAKGIQKGFLSANKQYSDKEIYDLIYKNGFSTHDVATDISGRGVGMDAIKEAITKLHGSIDIQTQKDVGTKTIIKLPPTLAIFNGIVIRVADKRYIIPSSEVHEIYQINLDEARNISNEEQIIRIRDEVYPIISIQKVFKLKSTAADSNKKIIMLVQHNRQFFALESDDVLVQQKIVYKNLGQELEGLPGVAGGTILADGKVAVILEIADLIELHAKSLS